MSHALGRDRAPCSAREDPQNQIGEKDRQQDQKQPDRCCSQLTDQATPENHAGGKAWMVPALSCAGIAAGADALLIEVHPCPPEAWCDADQALTPDEFAKLMDKLDALARALGRSVDRRKAEATLETI